MKKYLILLVFLIPSLLFSGQFEINDTLNLQGNIIDSVNTIITDTVKVDSSGLEIGGTIVTSTGAELNIMDGVTATKDELNILDGVTANKDELNYLDRGEAAGKREGNKAVVLDASSQIDIWLITDSLNVAGKAVFDSTVVIDDSVYVSDDIEATGTVTAKGGIFAGDVIVGDDVLVDSSSVINFHSGDVTITHSVNLLDIDGGNVRVDKLEIDSASDYIDVDTNLKIIAGADIKLDPVGVDVLIDGGLTVGSDTQAGDNNLRVEGDVSFQDSSYTKGKTVFDSTVSIGGWGYAGEHVIIPESSDNTNAGLGEYFMVDYSATAGKVFAGSYSRMLAMTTNQTNQSTMVGMESQFRLRDVDLADGVHSGLWAYAEQSGTSTLSGGGTFDAISATVESAADFTTGATEHITGITLDSSINGSAIINDTTNFAAIYIKSNGKDWFDGIKITGVTNDIELQNEETIDNATNGVINLTGNVQINGAGVNYCPTVGGTANALTLDYVPNITVLTAGLLVTFIADSANTGATTLTVDGLTTKDIYECSDISALEANDIRVGMVVQCVYDGVRFQQISQSGN